MAELSKQKFDSSVKDLEVEELVALANENAEANSDDGEIKLSMRMRMTTMIIQRLLHQPQLFWNSRINEVLLGNHSANKRKSEETIKTMLLDLLRLWNHSEVPRAFNSAKQTSKRLSMS